MATAFESEVPFRNWSGEPVGPPDPERQAADRAGALSFRSYYTYRARFCTPGQGREKGGVEGHIGYARRNFLVPVPEVADFQELNELLHERFQAQGRRRIRGREDARSIDERFEAERGRLLPLPETPFENTKILRSERTATRRSTTAIDTRCRGPTWAGGSGRPPIYLQDRKVVEHERIFANSKWDRPQALPGSDPSRGPGPSSSGGLAGPELRSAAADPAPR